MDNKYYFSFNWCTRCKNCNQGEPDRFADFELENRRVCSSCGGTSWEIRIGRMVKEYLPLTFLERLRGNRFEEKFKIYWEWKGDTK